VPSQECHDGTWKFLRRRTVTGFSQVKTGTHLRDPHFIEANRASRIDASEHFDTVTGPFGYQDEFLPSGR